MHQMVRNVAFSLAIPENRRFLAGVVWENVAVDDPFFKK